MTTRRTKYRTRAPFYYGHRWHWHVWQRDDANKHAAILEKARSLNAGGWDFGQAVHGRVGEVRF